MTAGDLQPPSLAQLLRQLREARGLTQRRLGEELNESRPLSPALISSWESGRAVPPDRWLEAYARTLAGPGDGAGGGDPVTSLRSRLTALRENAAGPGGRPAVGPVGRTGGRFWHFPDGRPVRIVSTSMYPEVMEAVPYSNAFHPNYIQSLGNADMDATAELYGHLRAENPDSDVRYLTRRGVGADDLTAHLVLLGGGDTLANPGEPPREPSALAWMMRRLDLPVFTRLPEGGDPEYDREFVVNLDDDGTPVVDGTCSEVHRPTFLGVGGHRVEFDGEGAPVAHGGYPQLEYDVGLLVRRQNPMNLSATLTLCTGVFSRGTFGVVRSLTDPQLRSRNEDYLAGHVDPDDFWLLMRIPVVHTRLGGRTVTPDLHRPFHVLRGWRAPGDLPGSAAGPYGPGPPPGPGPDR